MTVFFKFLLMLIFKETIDFNSNKTFKLFIIFTLTNKYINCPVSPNKCILTSIMSSAFPKNSVGAGPGIFRRLNSVSFHFMWLEKCELVNKQTNKQIAW